MQQLGALRGGRGRKNGAPPSRRPAPAISSSKEWDSSKLLWTPGDCHALTFFERRKRRLAPILRFLNWARIERGLFSAASSAAMSGPSGSDSAALRPRFKSIGGKNLRGFLPSQDRAAAAAAAAPELISRNKEAETEMIGSERDLIWQHSSSNGVLSFGC